MLTRDLVFDRVTVDFASPNFARVAWSYHRNFIDPEPYQTQLQFGYTGTPDADDWTDVGSPATNVFVTTDTVRRAFQVKEWDLHYRVKLVTPSDTYYSDAQQAHGILTKSDWLKAREIVRQQRLLHNKYTGWEGFLLKRKRRGTPPAAKPVQNRTIDPLTGDIVSTKRTEAAGTAFVDGYFTPVPISLELTPEAHNTERQDADRNRDMVVQGARVSAFPMIATEDVFVHAHSDRRYIIRPVRAVAQHRGVPLVLELELRQVEATDPVYNIAVS